MGEREREGLLKASREIEADDRREEGCRYLLEAEAAGAAGRLDCLGGKIRLGGGHRETTLGAELPLVIVPFTGRDVIACPSLVT